MQTCLVSRQYSGPGTVSVEDLYGRSGSQPGKAVLLALKLPRASISRCRGSSRRFTRRKYPAVHNASSLEAALYGGSHRSTCISQSRLPSSSIQAQVAGENVHACPFRPSTFKIHHGDNKSVLPHHCRPMTF